MRALKGLKPGVVPVLGKGFSNKDKGKDSNGKDDLLFDLDLDLEVTKANQGNNNNNNAANSPRWARRASTPGAGGLSPQSNSPSPTARTWSFEKYRLDEVAVHCPPFFWV